MIETWVQIVVGIAAIAVIAQMLVLTALALRLFGMIRRLEQVADEIQHHVSPLLARVRILVEEAQPRITAMLSDAAEITHTAGLQVQRVDRVVTEALDRLRMQLVHVDQIITGTLETIEESGAKLRRTVWGPIQSVSAVVRGVQAALEFYRGMRKRPRSSASEGEPAGVPEQQPDESLFI